MTISLQNLSVVIVSFHSEDVIHDCIKSIIDKIESLKFELRGELTIVISENQFYKKDSQNLDESDKRLIKKMINKLSVKEITSLINQQKEISKKEIYNYCLSIKNEN